MREESREGAKGAKGGGRLGLVGSEVDVDVASTTSWSAHGIHELVNRQWLPHSRSNDRASTLVYCRLQQPQPDRVVDAKRSIDHHRRQPLNVRLRALRAFA